MKFRVIRQAEALRRVPFFLFFSHTQNIRHDICARLFARFIQVRIDIAGGGKVRVSEEV